MSGYAPVKRLTTRGVVAIHEELLRRYGGQSREVDMQRLELALLRAESFAENGQRYVRARTAAAYAWFLLKLRPFAEGNERVALAAMVTSLEMQRVEWQCSEVEETVMVKAASKKNIIVWQWQEWVVGHSKLK